MAQVLSAEGEKSKKILDIYVGVSGTGKSTLIGTRDGGKTRGKGGCEADTKFGKITRDIKNPSLFMLDTQGICDSQADETGESDSRIIANIFKAMKEHRAQWIRVIWTIEQGERALPHLKRLAKFIHRLGKTKGNQTSQDIWKSVMIVCKEGSRAKHCSGALGAAAEAMRKSQYPYAYEDGQERQIICKVLTILDKLEASDLPRKLAQKMNGDERLASGYRWMKEVGDWQRMFLYSVNPIQVVFDDVKCRKCGFRGDPRELEPICHENFGHSGRINVDNRHKGEWIANCVSRNLDTMNDVGKKITPVLEAAAVVTAPAAEMGLAAAGVGIRWAVRGATGVNLGKIDELAVRGATIAIGTPLVTAKNMLPGGNVSGYWKCCGGKNENNLKCTEIIERYSVCGCLKGTPISSCPVKSCQVCHGRQGTHRRPNARCRGRHDPQRI